MSSARLEILISARDAATRTMEAVKAGFAARIADIKGMGDGLLKNGEKVEKFLQLTSLAKMATQTEGFKSALDGISPKLNDYVNNLTNVATAAALGAQALRSMMIVAASPAMAAAAGALAGAAPVILAAQSYQDMRDEQRNTAERQQARVFSAAEGARNARTRASFDLALRQLDEAAQDGIEGAAEVRASLMAQRTQILAYNNALDSGTKALREQAAAIRRENEAAAANRAAAAQVKLIQQRQFEATPQGQFEAFRDTQRNLADAKRLLAGTDPEAQAVRWLELNQTVEELTAKMEQLNAAPIGQMAAFISSARDRVRDFITKPRREEMEKAAAPDIIRTRLARLDADSAIRQGLGVGNVRSSLDVSITTRIAAAAEKQTTLLQQILAKLGLPTTALAAP